MNKASNPQSEPSMEEILASIRKIISEDQPEPVARAEEAESRQTPEPEVLELNAEAEIPPSEVEAAPAEEPAALAAEMAAPAESGAAEGAAEETEEGAVAMEMEQDDLISETTRHAVEEAVGSLEEAEPDRSWRPDGDSVEAVFARAVQEALAPKLDEWVNAHTHDILERMKPLIREWMDENLPHLIETAVQREISRALKARKR